MSKEIRVAVGNRIYNPNGVNTISDDDVVVQQLKCWLRGSTCYRKTRSIQWVSECGDYAVFKHHGHSEYVGMWDGSVWCETFYALYCMLSGESDVLGEPWLWMHSGRWSKRLLEDVKHVVSSHREQLKR